MDDLDDPAFWAAVASQVEMPFLSADNEPLSSYSTHQPRLIGPEPTPQIAPLSRSERRQGALFLLAVGLLILGTILAQGARTAVRSSDSHSARIPAGLPASPYVTTAWQDAQEARINPVYFVRQINQESGFRPNALSPAGAEGIAQFMPATAVELGIDPWNPDVALTAAARYMAQKLHQYGGNYAKALSAYNAGDGAVAWAVKTCGHTWIRCLPTETQHYLQVILSE